MEEVFLEAVICAMAASVLMIVHELSKALVYMMIQKMEHSGRKFAHSIWEVYRYVDPVGIILSITSSVTFSRPFMFRIQNKKTNLILGITGFLVLFFCFAGSIIAIHCHVLGVQGMQTMTGYSIKKCVTLFIQYMAILSCGMFFANLFPVSTFDMGLVIAGFSSQKYLNIIKMDAVIKIIFILAVLLNVIHYGGYRLIQLLL